MNEQFSLSLSGGLLGLNLSAGISPLGSGLPAGFSQGGGFANLLGQSLAALPATAGQPNGAGQALPGAGLNLPALPGDGLPPTAVPLSGPALRQLEALPLSEQALQELAGGRLSPETLQQLSGGQLSEGLLADLAEQGFTPELQQQLLQELEALGEQQPLSVELAAALRRRLELNGEPQAGRAPVDAVDDGSAGATAPPAGEAETPASGRREEAGTAERPVPATLPLVFVAVQPDGDSQSGDAAAQQVSADAGAIQNRALAQLLDSQPRQASTDANRWLSAADRAILQVQQAPQVQPLSQGGAVAGGLDDRLERASPESGKPLPGMAAAAAVTATGAANPPQPVPAAPSAALALQPSNDEGAQPSTGARAAATAQAVAAAGSVTAQAANGQAVAGGGVPAAEPELDPQLAERLRTLTGDGADSGGREGANQNGGGTGGGQHNGASAGAFSQLVRQAAGEPAATVQQPQQFSLPGAPRLNAPNWPSALGERVVWLAGQQNKVAEIQLDPPELGSLQVRIQVNQDQVSVSFVSPHASVRDTVEQGLARLREMFAEQGLNLADSSVADQSSGGRDGGGEGGEDERAGYAQSALGGEDELSQQADAQGLSLVDYYA